MKQSVQILEGSQMIYLKKKSLTFQFILPISTAGQPQRKSLYPPNSRMSPYFLTGLQSQLLSVPAQPAPPPAGCPVLAAWELPSASFLRAALLLRNTRHCRAKHLPGQFQAQRSCFV